MGSGNRTGKKPGNGADAGPRARRALLLAIALLACAWPAVAPAATLPEPLASSEALVEPPNDTRPGMRWWWLMPYADEEFAREVGQISDAGFGLAELGYNADGFANDAQRSALTATLEEAKARKTRIDITMGPGWPLTNDAVKAGTGLSQQELDYGRRDLVGPLSYSGPVPAVRAVDPCTATSNPLQGCAAGASEGELVAVTAARVLQPGSPAALAPTQTNLDPALRPVSTPTVLEPESLVDLTSNVDAGGNLTWDVPAGQWVVFGFYQRPSAQDVVDHLRKDSSKALVGFLDKNVIADNGERLRGLGGDFFEDSIEIATTMLWTEDIVAEFKRRRGYDLTKHLPLLFVPGFYVVPVPERVPTPEYDLPDGLGDRVRHDFWQTLDDLYIANHAQPFQEWAKTYGMRYRVQAAYAGTFNVIRHARDITSLGGAVDHESRNAGDPTVYGDPTWHFAFDNYRELAGGAHQGGSSDTSLELGATNARDFMVTLAEYKALTDKAWAAGITRPIIHGLPYQHEGAAWPGASRFGGLIANSWNPNTWPEWKLLRPLTDYWARGNLILRQGRPQVDVAVYRDGFTTWAASYADIGFDVADDGLSPAFPGDPLHSPDGTRPLDRAVGANTPAPFFSTRRLERAGYGIEYVDPLGLGTRDAGAGKVLYPQGPSYRALVIDERRLPAAAAQAIARNAGAGLAVVFVGELPSHGTGAADATREDEAVRQAVKSILEAPRVARARTQDHVAATLARLGVEPDARWSSPAPIYTQHRATGGSDYFYLWNAGTKRAVVNGSFATRGAGFVVDLWSGRRTRLQRYQQIGDRVAVPLDLAPGETKVLAFRRGESVGRVVAAEADVVSGPRRTAEVRDTRPGTRSVVLSDGSERTVTLPDLPRPLPLGRWRLRVAESNPEGDVTKDVELASLADWRDIPELAESSGSGTYTTSFDLQEDRVGPDRGAYLGLGRVEGAVQVFVNDRLVTPAVIAPRRLDVTPLLRRGKNELRIELATSLKNRLVALTKKGAVAGGAAGLLPATQAYGVVGPASLVSFGRAGIQLPRAACASRRVIAVHVRPPKGFKARRATLSIRGRTRKVDVHRRGGRLRVRVDLRRLTGSTARVVIRVRGAGGRSLRVVRRYQLCAKRASSVRGGP